MNFELKIRKSEMLIFLLLLPLYRPPYLAIAKFSYMDAFFFCIWENCFFRNSNSYFWE